MRRQVFGGKQCRLQSGGQGWVGWVGVNQATGKESVLGEEIASEEEEALLYEDEV